jgi:hypothetical protein
MEAPHLTSGLLYSCTGSALTRRATARMDLSTSIPRRRICPALMGNIPVPAPSNS